MFEFSISIAFQNLRRALKLLFVKIQNKCRDVGFYPFLLLVLTLYNISHFNRFNYDAYMAT